MKVLLFCNNIQSAQIVFELIRNRVFAGIVIPDFNEELIHDISESGYVEPSKLFTVNVANDDEIIRIINTVTPDVGMVVTFPKIFSASIINIPRLGFYNFHYGILPEYRSADPIFWQIKNGEKFGGVTIIKMNSEIDGGDILLEEKIPIEPYDSYAVLLNKSVAIACHIVDPFLSLINQKDTGYKTQDKSVSKYFPRPQLADVCIDWSTMEMNEIMATVNAGNPWNRGAIATFEGEKIRIVQVSPAKYDKELPDIPGKIVFANEQYGVFVICKNGGLLRIDTVYSNLGYNSGGMILRTGIIEGKIFQ